jgi:biopolymer transport protein ExbD
MSRLIRQRDNDNSTGIDLTPMLDVIFIMLIFFIVTASFVKEYGLVVTQPKPSPSPSTTTEEQKNIILQVTETNEIWLDERRIDIRSVRANIQRLHAQNPKATLIIQSHPKAKNDTLIKIADQSREANVEDVALIVQP